MGSWKNIRKGWVSSSRHTRLRMGDDNRTSFWNDVWIGDTVLKDAYPAIFITVREQDALL